LLRAVEQHPVSRVVFASSSEVYGEPMTIHSGQRRPSVLAKWGRQSPVLLCGQQGYGRVLCAVVGGKIRVRLGKPPHLQLLRPSDGHLSVWSGGAGGSFNGFCRMNPSPFLGRALRPVAFAT
jgi:hypothetical protein